MALQTMSVSSPIGRSARNTDTTVFIIIKEHFGGFNASGFVDFIGDFEWQTFVFYRQHCAFCAGVKYGGICAKGDFFFIFRVG